MPELKEIEMRGVENILKNNSILVIEDNPGDFALVEEFLSDKIKDIRIVHAKTYSDATIILSNEATSEFDAILLDLSLPDNTGADLITEVVALSKNIPVIILTGCKSVLFGAGSLSLGVSDYLLKDELTPETLYKSILHSCEQKKANLQLLDYIQSIEEQNRQLRDIAWIQSHVVRAPLARIIGLVDLFKDLNNADEDRELIVRYLLQSAQQLDDIIKQITNKAHEKIEWETE